MRVVREPALDRKAERNTYRQALITQDQSARSLTQRHDEIVLEVRESWRALEQAKRTYEIALIGVKVAERRVEELELLAELCRGRAQEQVDAETSLLQSRDTRTQALVGHTIARLQFWDNLGILYIKANGQWEEVEHGQGQ
jgi:outer membrane protein TolC